MKLYTTISSLQEALDVERAKGFKIGFVPTMGALHEGHLSLADKAAVMADIVVVSVFVNPNQFNDPTDLVNYPRTLDSDIELLESRRCDYLFYPAVSEVYPLTDTRQFEFGLLESVMEGEFRPGHFNGVAQVVSRLFEIVSPDMAFFGQKDFQQLAIIKDLVSQLNLPVRIIPCDIVREKDGLAMSSRNKLLLPQHRASAPLIYRTLLEAQKLSCSKSVQEVKAYVNSTFNSNPLLNIEYFDIVDDLTLSSVDTWNQPGVKVGCIALYAGKIRLIDNIIFNVNQQ